MKKNLIILTCFSILMFTACEGHKEPDLMVNEFCKKYAVEYKSVEENGTNKISIKAPDFEKVMKELSNKYEAQEVDAKIMQEVIDEHPDYTKTYEFDVEEIDEEKIEEAFLQEISKELIVNAIEEIPFEESWGTEE